MRTANVCFDFETMPLEPGNNYEMQVTRVSANPNGRVLVEAKTSRLDDGYPEPLPPLPEEPSPRPNPRRRPTELERTKARTRGKAARKARRVGR